MKLVRKIVRQRKSEYPAGIGELQISFHVRNIINE